VWLAWIFGGVLLVSVLISMLIALQNRQENRLLHAAFARAMADDAGGLADVDNEAFALARLSKALRLDAQSMPAISWATSLLERRFWWFSRVRMQHTGGVISAVFSPDGRRVVTASFDKTARVWDAESRKPVGVPLAHTDMVYSAVFSPDGRRVATASEDKTARVWLVLFAAPDEQDGETLAMALESVSGYRSMSSSPSFRLTIQTRNSGIFGAASIEIREMTSARFPGLPGASCPSRLGCRSGVPRLSMEHGGGRLLSRIAILCCRASGKLTGWH
jgi:hypothetical protein